MDIVQEMKKINGTKSLLLFASFLLLGRPLHAVVTSYSLSAPASVMIGDTSLMVTVQPLDEFGNPDNTPSHRVKFVNLPAGVTVTPNDLVNGTPITGLSTFSLYAGGAAAPGTFGWKNPTTPR